MKGRLIPALLALGLAAVLVSSISAAVRWKVVASKRASGDFAIALAAGNASHPLVIAVRVFAVPNQSVSGNWTMVCSKGLGAGSKSGRFVGRTPLLRLTRMPMSRPNNCTASAGAQLSKSGTVRVQILKR
jgi:hypothetical protein